MSEPVLVTADRQGEMLNAIRKYEKEHELPLCEARAHVEYGVSGIWLAVSAGMGYLCYRQWSAAGRQTSFESLYRHQWTVLEQRFAMAYGALTLLAWNRGAIADYHYRNRAQKTKLETHYTLLVVEVATYLVETKNDKQIFDDFEADYTKYLGLPLHEDAIRHSVKTKAKDGSEKTYSGFELPGTPRKNRNYLIVSHLGFVFFYP